MNTSTETALIKQSQWHHAQRSWVWLLDRLKDYVDLRGCRPEDDERLAALYEDTYFEAQFMTDPEGKIGPTADIMSAFRENAELWLSACPAEEHVVVLPRKLAEQLIAAIPVSLDGPLRGMGMKLEYAEHAGHSLLRSGAAAARIEREDSELTAGQRARERMMSFLDNYMKTKG